MANIEKRRILVFGDSHVQAVQQALTDGAASGRYGVEVYFRKIVRQNGETIGSTSQEEIVERISGLGPRDLAVSMLMGNFHHVAGLVQHPVPFDFLLPGEDRKPESGCRPVPFRVMEAFFENNLRPNNRILRQLVPLSAAPIRHLMAPPPKADEALIMKRPEIFKDLGIFERGISPAPLRLRLWHLQARVMARLCAEFGAPLVGVPEGAQCPDGFLKPEYCAEDATHANAGYGALVIKQIEAIMDQGSIFMDA